MKYKVGDVCVLVPCKCSNPYKEHYVELECTIVGINPEREHPYTLNLRSLTQGTNLIAKDLCLELKKPPSAYDGNQATSWDKLPWQPLKHVKSTT